MSSNSTPSGRRAPVQKRARATVASLLDAAAEVVVERGVAGAGTGKIAAAAGVSVGALYEYFPNKEAILTALVERRLAEIALDRDLALEGAPVADAGAVVVAIVRAELFARAGTPLDTALFGAVPPRARPAIDVAERRLAGVVTERLLGLPGVQPPPGAASLVARTLAMHVDAYRRRGLATLDEDAFAHALATLLRGVLGGPSEAPQLGVGGGSAW